MNQNTKKERVLWIDAVKGIGITLMFLGHMNISSSLHAFIYSFHMPLFVIISGYLFRADNTFLHTLKRRAQALLLPYLYTGMAALCVRLTLLTISGNFTFSGAFAISRAQTKAVILGMGFARNLFVTNTESVGPIWFVPFLFCAYMIYFLLEKTVGNKNRVRSVLLLFLVVALSFCGYYIGAKIAFLPWSLDASLVAIPLFYVGTRLRQHGFFEKKYCIIAVILLTAFWLLLYRRSGMVALVTRAYESFPLCLLVSIAASIVVMYLFFLCEKRKVTKFLLMPPAWCGQHSMLLLAIHTVECWYVGWLDTIQAKSPNLLCSYIIYLILLITIAWAILFGKKLLSILFSH